MSYSEPAITPSRSSLKAQDEYEEHPYPNSPNIIDINYRQADLYDTRMTASDITVLKKLDLAKVSSAEEATLASAVWKGMY